MVLTFLGACLALTLVDARNVIRSDGSHVILMKHPSWQSEILGLWEVLQSDVWIVFLFPMFFASNWFYTYHFNDFNSAKFNIRTRSLNSVLYWISQIIGAYIFGYALDVKSVRRSMRAKIVWTVLLVITFAIWGGGYAWQRTYTRGETSDKTYVKEDFEDSGYVGPMFLYMFYGFYDGMFFLAILDCHKLTQQQLPGKPPSTGSWAPSQITAANLLTSPASTKAFSPPVRPSSTASMHWGRRS